MEKIKICLACLSFAMIFFLANFTFAQNNTVKESRKVQVLLEQADHYFSNKKFDKAIATYNKILREVVSPGEKAEVLFLLSSSYVEKGNLPYISQKNDTCYKKAVEYAQESLKIKPEYWYPYANIAKVYMNMEDLEKSDIYFEQAKKFADPMQAGYQQMIGQSAAVKELLRQKQEQGK